MCFYVFGADFADSLRAYLRIAQGAGSLLLSPGKRRGGEKNLALTRLRVAHPPRSFPGATPTARGVLEKAGYRWSGKMIDSFVLLARCVSVLPPCGFLPGFPAAVAGASATFSYDMVRLNLAQFPPPFPRINSSSAYCHADVQSRLFAVFDHRCKHPLERECFPTPKARTFARNTTPPCSNQKTRRLLLNEHRARGTVLEENPSKNP